MDDQNTYQKNQFFKQYSVICTLTSMRKCLRRDSLFILLYVTYDLQVVIHLIKRRNIKSKVNQHRKKRRDSFQLGACPNCKMPIDRGWVNFFGLHVKIGYISDTIFPPDDQNYFLKVYCCGSQSAPSLARVPEVAHPCNRPKQTSKNDLVRERKMVQSPIAFAKFPRLEY